MPTLRAYVPDQLLAGGAFHGREALVVRDGLVDRIGQPPPGAELVPLPGRMLVPGLVSAHGHAFQRAVRGRAERRAAGSFWGWRSAMYAAARRLDPDALEKVARFAFFELARAGVTCAGEFHYLHRDPDGRPYPDPDELALRVVRAARTVGLRIVLLRAAYGRAGAGASPDPAQARFLEESPAVALAAVDRLRGALAGDPLATVGLAPHSVRACPPDWIGALAEAARARDIPLHVHAAEQPAEVAACRAEHGRSPVGLLASVGALGPTTTLVHAIHVDDADVAVIGSAGATVCACPLTERNLGDGVVPADRLLAAGARLALGVDSHAEVDPLGEARALEGHLRLVRGARAVLDDPPGALPARLLDAATAGGMASLGIPGGRLDPGDPADFVLVDLDDPSLAGAEASPDALLATLVLGTSPGAVKSTFVGGEPIVEDGWTTPGRPTGAELLADFREVMAELWGRG
ncbi:formimidoylglutamate deiminase [Anaeromyxobacter oryzae]|uniref:Formimidoylglutamate deiminase n=1 Tax=Anaeromyxobacter oryzae TaxID=2918170 RepID=A0ABM7WXH7_9BACT|nr:formimidoylglutamate deiminase [Anaeromyxobacter oryzae]BDG04217.1 formimidoylglutamate deiminase [Anaeromyxobacter oryzae]